MRKRLRDTNLATSCLTKIPDTIKANPNVIKEIELNPKGLQITIRFYLTYLQRCSQILPSAALASVTLLLLHNLSPTASALPLRENMKLHDNKKIISIKKENNINELMNGSY